jgi:hypothetical protein
MDNHKMHESPRPLPTWLVVGVSAGIVIHLAALAVLVTAAPSGPWPSPFEGPSPRLAPEFAGALNRRVGPLYLQPLHLTHTYHYTTDQVEASGVFFEVVLKDENGKIIDTLQFPDKKANRWVVHRQRMLAQSIGEDQPVMPSRSVAIDAPGQQAKTVTIWDSKDGEAVLTLKKVRLHEVSRDRPVFRPTEWSQLLAKSYMRYLCRKHGAASATLIRHSRDAIGPETMYMEQLPPWEEMKANFGEYRAEN